MSFRSKNLTVTYFVLQLEVSNIGYSNLYDPTQAIHPCAEVPGSKLHRKRGLNLVSGAVQSFYNLLKRKAERDEDISFESLCRLGE